MVRPRAGRRRRDEHGRRPHLAGGRTRRRGPPWAWRHWHTTWEATPGDHVLSVRATDAEGHTQPLEQPWNRGGFANNLVQRVPVLCLEAGA